MNENKLTLREQTIVYMYRCLVAWLLAMTDDEYDAYMALPFEARLALYRSQPFYRAV